MKAFFARLGKGGQVAAGVAAAAGVVVIGLFLLGPPQPPAPEPAAPARPEPTPAPQPAPEAPAAPPAQEDVPAPEPEAPAEAAEAEPEAPAAAAEAEPEAPAEAAEAEPEAPAEEAEPQPEAAAPESPADPAAAVSAEPQATPAAPRFDVVRVDAQGGAVVAGVAPPLSQVLVLVDGAEAASVRADRRGSFAALLDLPESAAPRVLTLEAVLEGGTRLESVDTVLLAPVAPLPAVTDPAPPSLAEGPPAAAGEALAEAAPTSEPPPEPTAGADAAPPLEMAAVSELPDGRVAQTEVPVEPTAAPALTASDPDPATVAEAPATAAEEEVAEAAPPPGPVVTPADPEPLTIAEAPATATDETVAEAAPAEVAAAPEAPEPAPVATSAAPVEGPPAAPPVVLAEPALPGLPGDAPAAPAPIAPPVVPVAPQTPAIVALAPEGARVMQPAGDPPPQVMQNVVIETITYAPDGAVVVAGRGSGERAVRIYLDNRPLAEAATDSAGLWRSELPSIDTGLYTLRADEVDATGRVTSRFETPFRRESPETVAAVAAAPERGARAEVITVQPGQTLWGISRATYGRGILYVHVFAANEDQIRNPDRIYPGQVFALPELAPAQLTEPEPPRPPRR